MARGVKGSGKKAVKKTVKRRAAKKEDTVIGPSPVMEALMAAARRPHQNLERTTDARSMVIGALGAVLSDVTNAVIALSQAAVQAPTITDKEFRS